MASINQHKSGGYIVRWYGSRDAATGKQARHSKVFESHADAKSYARDIAQSEGRAAATDTIGPAMLAWIETRESMGRISAKTAHREKQLATAWANLLGPVRVSKVDAATLQKALTQLATKGGMKGKPLSGRSLHHMRQKMSQFLGQQVRAGTLPSNAAHATIAPKVAKPKALAPSDAQVTALRDLADASTRCNGQLGMIVALAMQTGTRRGEVCGLRWADLDLDARVLSVNQAVEHVDAVIRFKEPKTQAGKRSMPISDALVLALRDHKRNQSVQRLAAGADWAGNDLVICNALGEPCNPEEISRRVGLLRRGIEGWPDNCAPLHGLRHWHGTKLNAAGLDAKTIQGRLGHEDIRITLQLYVHRNDAADRRAADVFDAFG